MPDAMAVVSAFLAEVRDVTLKLTLSGWNL